MVSRWFIALQKLNFKVIFVKGTQNQLADGLSRLCPNIAKLALPFTPVATSHNEIVLSALTVIPEPNPEQVEWMEQCRTWWFF